MARTKLVDAELIAETGTAVAVDVGRSEFMPIGGVMFPIVVQVRSGTLTRGQIEAAA